MSSSPADRRRAPRVLFQLAALLVALLTLGAPARADVFRLGDFGFYRGEEPGTYELVATIPEAVATGGTIGWPEGCTETSRDRLMVEAGRIRFAFQIRCSRPLSATDTVTTPWPVDAASFTSTATGAKVESALSPGDSGVVLPVGETIVRERTLGQIAYDYTLQGIFHILGGWDHLAFVLCLCLLAQGRALLLLVTTFTVGHSISLGLAFFDVIAIPVPPVEAVIALSIMFMAREALMATGTDAVGARLKRYVVVVAGFGLLHGLGFATVLRELGVTPAERVPGLVFFNAGVEIGQLLFVACVLGVMAAARAVGQAAPVRATALYAAGIVGGFWMLERVAGFTLLPA